jgi:hypothetical protein
VSTPNFDIKNKSMNQQNNPWEELLKGPNFYFKKDKEIIDKHNSNLGPHPLFIDLELLPEPYIGNPNANVVILLTNPGSNGNEKEDYKIHGLVDAIKNNLTHSNKEYPYYYLHPDFIQKTGGGRWIYERMKDIIEKEEIDAKELSKKIFAIQLHPYHSARFTRFKKINDLEGQKYSMELLSLAIERKALIVFTRTQKEWDKAYEQFDSNTKELKKIPGLNFIELQYRTGKTPRSPYFNKKHMKQEDYEKLKEALLRSL